RERVAVRPAHHLAVRRCQSVADRTGLRRQGALAVIRAPPVIHAPRLCADITRVLATSPGVSASGAADRLWVPTISHAQLQRSGGAVADRGSWAPLVNDHEQSAALSRRGCLMISVGTASSRHCLMITHTARS